MCRLQEMITFQVSGYRMKISGKFRTKSAAELRFHQGNNLVKYIQ